MGQKTTLLIPEHFDQLVTMADDHQKADYLRSVSTPALKEMLRLSFDPAVQFDTPIPEYKPDDSPLGLAYNSLYSEYRRFYLFQSSVQHITVAKKQNLLAQILESIHATEAMLVERVIRKDLSDYDITENVVRLAFPDLLPPRADVVVVAAAPEDVPMEAPAKSKKITARKPRAKKSTAKS